jgi:ribosome-binding factor A
MSVRPERVAQFMRREIAEILEHRLSDPRLAGLVVSVTDVEVTRDLSSAKVFVSVLETGEARARALDALQSAVGFVRHLLGTRLELREIPEIRFIHDASIERGARVEELLRKLADGQTPPDQTPPDGAESVEARPPDGPPPEAPPR